MVLLDATSTDTKAKVSANDTKADTLINKIVAGDDITITELNDGGVETIEVKSTATISGGMKQLVSFNMNVATFPASNVAAAFSRNGHPIVNFDDSSDESIIFHGIMSKDYADDNIIVDLDWIAKTATSGDVRWGLEFERMNAGGHDLDADSFNTQQVGTSTTNGTSGIITRTSITVTQAQADAIAAGDSFRLRVERVATDAADTMTGDAQLLRVNLRQ